MIESLHISNYALIDTIDIDFSPGLNIITGETGAGKSIILGALSLLLGSRADSRAVKRPEKKSVIEAVFNVEGNTGLERYCTGKDIDTDPAHCILRREISPSGRSRGFVNDTPVPLSTLEEVALMLVDLHSQNRNRLLADNGFQLDIIDTLSGNAALLQEHGRRYRLFRSAMLAFRDAKREIERTRNDEEFTRFQLDQINAASPMAGELEELERDRDVIANAAAIKSRLATLLDTLTNGTVNAADLLAEACNDIDKLDSLFAGEEKRLRERLESAIIDIRDISLALEKADRTVDSDPGMLEDTDNRISQLRGLLRRHNLETVEELITLRDTLAKRLARLDDSETVLADLEREARRTHALARETARKLSESRKHTALQLAEKLRETAVPLGMKNLRCEIAVVEADLSATGCDAIEFRFAFNKQQQPVAVGASASGGEVSRIMLALKTIVAESVSLPSIIFDEVDTGVSGEVANRMGQMMRSLAGHIQVIAITHLPQVAAKGEKHFKVFKQDDDTATHTYIRHLSDDERVAELAQMLSGENATETAEAAARELLDQ